MRKTEEDRRVHVEIASEMMRPPVTVVALQNQLIQPATPKALQKSSQTERDFAPPAPATHEPGSDNKEDWLEVMMQLMWKPWIKNAVNTMAYEQLPLTLKESKPSWIHGLTLTKFRLGDKMPDIKSIRCYSDNDEIMDDVFMDIDLEWKSEQDIEITVEVLGDSTAAAIPDVIEKGVSKMLSIVVGVENFCIDGVLRIAFRPLLEVIPVIGAAQVAFKEIPKFDYTPTIHGGPLGTVGSGILPMFRGWLDSTIKENLLRPLTLPEHMFFPVAENVEDLNLPKGIITCTIVEAKDLPRMDLLALPGKAINPYVEVFVRHTQRHRTAVADEHPHNPHWDETFHMPVHEPDRQELVVRCWDFDAFASNDEVGSVTIPVSELKENEEQDMWLSLKSESEEIGKEQRHKPKAEKKQESKGMRAGAKLSKLAETSVGKSKVHVKIHYRTWTPFETKLIAKGYKEGIRNVLKGPSGKRVDPHLRNLLQSGALQVKIERCEGLDVSGFFMRPKVKAVVSIGDTIRKETSAFQVSRRGNVSFLKEPIEVEVEGTVTENTNTSVFVEFFTVGWFGGGKVGHLYFPLQEILSSPETKISGRRLLQGGKGGAVELELDWIGYFGD